MKKSKLVLFFVMVEFALLVLCACNETSSDITQSNTTVESQDKEFTTTLTDNDEESTSSLITEPYEYPVRPGMEGWSKLASLQEMIDASQVPVDIVDKMTTDALARTVIEYPLVVNTLAYDTPKEGIEEVSNYFYGLRTLLQRDDAKQVLERLQEEGIYGGEDNLSNVRNRFLKNLITYLQ